MVYGWSAATCGGAPWAERGRARGSSSVRDRTVAIGCIVPPGNAPTYSSRSTLVGEQGAEGKQWRRVSAAVSSPQGCNARPTAQCCAVGRALHPCGDETAAETLRHCFPSAPCSPTKVLREE